MGATAGVHSDETKTSKFHLIMPQRRRLAKIKILMEMILGIIMLMVIIIMALM